MIALSKLDGSTMHVNEDHIERVEGETTSVVYLTNGTYLVVRDPVAAIVERIRAEKVAILARAISGPLTDREGPGPSEVVSGRRVREART